MSMRPAKGMPMTAAEGTSQARRDAPALLAQAIALAVRGLTLVLAAAELADARGRVARQILRNGFEA